jgi:hypothetical protein
MIFTILQHSAKLLAQQLYMISFFAIIPAMGQPVLELSQK